MQWWCSGYPPLKSSNLPMQITLNIPYVGFWTIVCTVIILPDLAFSILSFGIGQKSGRCTFVPFTVTIWQNYLVCFINMHQRSAIHSAIVIKWKWWKCIELMGRLLLLGYQSIIVQNVLNIFYWIFTFKPSSKILQGDNSIWIW